jgi:hypothetical protein
VDLRGVEPLRYEFEISNGIETQLLEPDGTSLPAPYLQPAELSWSGTLEQSVSRRFRDGSQGDRVRFIEVSRRSGAAPPQPSELSGKSVELRSFNSREILSISLLDRLVGEPRQADLSLALWPALSPQVPEIEPGERVEQRSNLPFMLDSGMGMPISLDLTWSVEGPLPCEAGSCWRFLYEGPVHGRGRDRSERWLARYQLSGNAQGELWLRKADNGIHSSVLELDFELRTTIADPATQVPRGLIVQHHRQRSTLREVRP